MYFAELRSLGLAVRNNSWLVVSWLVNYVSYCYVQIVFVKDNEGRKVYKQHSVFCITNPFLHKLGKITPALFRVNSTRHILENRNMGSGASVTHTEPSSAWYCLGTGAVCILCVYSALMSSFNNGFETLVKILRPKGRPWGMSLKEGRDLCGSCSQRT